MSTLKYTAVNSAQGWTGTVNINYTAVYDPETNQTTVTFAESSHEYFGRSGYGTSYSTNITVKADDNAASTATAVLAASGITTNGGVNPFYGTPSPVSVTVAHSSAAGDKSVTIAGVTSINAYMASTAIQLTTGTGSGSVSVVTGTREEQGLVHIDNGSEFEDYQMYIDNGTGWDGPYVLCIDNGTGWDACG